MRWTASTTTSEPTPISANVTGGFLTKLIATTFRSLTIRRGCARSVSVSTVAANWSRARSISCLMASGSRSATSSSAFEGLLPCRTTLDQSPSVDQLLAHHDGRDNHTMTARLDVGDNAPTFSLPDADGNTVSLADYRGRKVVVYFYPAASTPGCTKEACDFRDNLGGLNDAGIDVVG